MILLEVREIHTYYGLSHVLHGISLNVQEGEVVCLLGRNGAGKSTTIRSIMGLTPPAQGSIRAFNLDIHTMKPYDIFKHGIRWIPQGRKIFPMLTVEENLKLALISEGSQNQARELTQAYELFPILRAKRRSKANTLSGGQLQMAAIARALIGPTRLILMDEPTEGLAPLIIQQIGEVIRSIKDQGKTVLLAEQNLQLALSVADRHYIIDNGQIKFTGTGQELDQNEEVKRTYLGVGG